MSGDSKRWKKAQSVERVHSSHKGHAKDYEQTLSKYGLSRSDLIGSDILAVGAGTGIIHSIDVDCTTVAVDPLTASFKDVLKGSSAHLLTGIGETLPFEDDCFDIIISRNVLDHTIDPATVLSEIRRLLRPDGAFVLDVNVYELPRFVRKHLSLIDRPHPHHFSPTQVTGMLQSSGFDVEHLSVEKMNPMWRNFRIKRIVATKIFRIRKLHATAQ